MKKVESLKAGTKLDNGRYVIQANLTPGIDCLTYLANDGCSIVKEYCPDGATRNGDGSLNGCGDSSKFKGLADVHRRITDGVIGVNSLGTYDLFEENNTMYFVYDFSGNDIRADFLAYNGWYGCDYGIAVFHNSYDDFIKTNRDKMTLYDIIYPVWLAAHIMHEYHKNGYVHVNLKPEKLLVSTDSYNKPVAVQVLETGSMIREDDNESGFVVTNGWSDRDLVSMLTDEVDGRCDVYSLGMILFRMAVKPSDDTFDIEYEVTFHASFPFERSECSCVVSADENIKKKLTDVFEHSMRCYRGSRYDTALQFADALADIIKDLPETDLRAFGEEEARIREWHNLV